MKKNTYISAAIAALAILCLLCFLSAFHTMLLNTFDMLIDKAAAIQHQFLPHIKVSVLFQQGINHPLRY
ncbi:MAG: hypothetical protein QM802_24860 [Agriterribacter sp.]